MLYVWIVLAVCVLLFALLILLATIRIWIRLDGMKLALTIKIGQATVFRFPLKPSKGTILNSEHSAVKKRKNKQKKEKTENRKEKNEIRDTIRFFIRMMEHIRNFLGEFLSRLCIEDLRIQAVVAASNAAFAAAMYGVSAAAVYTVLPTIEQNFNLKNKQIRVDLDFQKSAPEILIETELSIKLMALLKASLKFAIRFVGEKLNKKNKKAV